MQLQVSMLYALYKYLFWCKEVHSVSVHIIFFHGEQKSDLDEDDEDIEDEDKEDSEEEEEEGEDESASESVVSEAGTSSDEEGKKNYYVHYFNLQRRSLG